MYTYVSNIVSWVSRRGLRQGERVNPIVRLALEIKQLSRIVSYPTLARYLGNCIRVSPAVVCARSLVPADRTVRGTVSVTCNRRSFQVPVGQITDILNGHDSTPTFGAIREMYGANVYLRAFRPLTPLRRVVDLGANRGLFSLLALAAYGAEVAIGVEPNHVYGRVAMLLCEANGLGATSMPRHTAMVAGSDGDGRVTLRSLMSMHAIDEIDFLKCDIEGGEFEVLGSAYTPLAKVRNMALELHHEAGDADSLCAHLCQYGFTLRTTDQFGCSAPPKRSQYLYASRTGDLT